MKIVHSFWSKPSLNKSSILEKSNGGWRNPKYHYMSWALSCLNFVKFYSEVELITDIEGKKMLIDKLKLPYTSVKVVLDCLNKYPEQLWAIGKVYSYSIQEKPFIHADSDVYIWKRFPKEFEKSDIIAQNLDSDKFYHIALDHLKKHEIIIPKILKEDLKNNKVFNSSNMGIVGGTNFDFFKKYSKTVFDYIDSNLKQVKSTLIGANYAMFYEQYLFSALARKNKIEITHLFQTSKTDIIINHSSFLNRFGNKKYVHILGNTKQFFENCIELEHNLLYHYPEFHARISSMFKD